MQEHYVTCTSIGSYAHAVTRGFHYQVFAEKANLYKILANHGKRIWIAKYHFTEGKIILPLLVRWKFDDNPDDVDMIELSCTFSDGSVRWCLITTPEKLVYHFRRQELSPPGFAMPNLIINTSLNEQDVEATLRELDQQGELMNVTVELFTNQSDETLNHTAT